ncbi:hypothetical protein QBC41DRAFT_1667 [Cercophora samala]|uniref:Uncharacterized protein n=1 Tax=Cercophora samala TaxID=330535 RepID=A0AA39ZNK6_9PEZI|nr:hypothetical protein QBC41DRAFT_1667 [Cercophora samala]
MAGPGPDADEINDFLRTYTSSDYTGYGSYQFGVDTPRFPDIANSDLIDDSESAYSYSDAQSYTTTPTIASRAHSHTTTSTMQSSKSSVFSHQNSWDYQSSMGKTSIASGRRTLGAQPAAASIVNPTHHAGELWCEFSALQGCTATFRLDDEYSWIQHHIWHLRDVYPFRSKCWFCDDFQFVARNSDDDLYPTFYDRMQHIRTHISQDGKTSRQARPDFHVVDHMYQQRLISEEAYQEARMRFDELPPAYRIPGMPGAAPPSSSSSLSRPARSTSTRYRMDDGGRYSRSSGHRSRR